MTVLFLTGLLKNLGRPVDKKENYIKRCVGISGDIVEIVDGQLFVNQKKHNEPAEMKKQFFYQIKTSRQHKPYFYCLVN